MNAVVLYLLLLRATALSFSGFASVPVIREDLVVTRGVLTDQELNSAIAISQASPGPLGLYVVVVGYFVAGVPGALAGALALASPAILAIPIARAVRRHQDSQVRGGSAAIVIASCVLMATTTVRLVPDAAPNGQFGVSRSSASLLWRRDACHLLWSLSCRLVWARYSHRRTAATAGA